MTVRVTAGTARGRQLATPKSELRPTSDKVKQAIFSMLEAEALRRGFEGDEDAFAAMRAWPRVLDLFAGSGALGIEAISRGAAETTFIDKDRLAVQTISQNLERTGFADRAQIRRGSLPATLSTLSGPYDLIVLDPPYRETTAALTTLLEISARQILSDGGVVVWEHDRAAAALALPAGLHCLRQREYGTTTVSLLERDACQRQGEHD